MANDWTDALAEAYASAPADEFIISTLEILHAAFVDDQSPANPDSIRIALDDRSWNLQLEAAAPLKGGQTVLFEPLAIKVVQPQQEDGNMGTMKLSLDNVPLEYIKHLELAAATHASARLIYREWIAIKSSGSPEWEVSGPPDYIVGELTVKVVDVNMLTIEAEALFLDLLNKSFPLRIFSREDFPAIFGGDSD
jgi:hypothetical protein